ncbi:MAG: FAD-dependent oxidoreductase [Pseudomonadota bacterium]
MAKTVILGAGFAGQYAALILSDALKGKGNHEVIVVNPTDTFTYIPSLIWVAVGQLSVKKAQFALKSAYKRVGGITFVQGLATEVHPDEQYIIVEPRDGTSKEPVRIGYDYLINATGPHLNFEATPGLGPEKGHTYSICTPAHAEQTAQRYLQWVDELKKGRRATFVVGTGHGTCTCQGAAFEFISLLHNDLTDRGLRKQVDLKWISNEPCLGDFGIDGFETQMGPITFTSEDMAEAVYRDYDINYQIRSHVQKVDEKCIYTEDYDGKLNEISYDFAMLIPQFRGKPIRYLDKNGGDLSGTLLNPGGFMKVDAVYGKPYDQLDGPDWPKTYQNQTYKNMFAVGIAFAPPGFMSKPYVSASGTPISPAIPRTGYTSELTGKAAALNIAEMIQGREPCHTASMAETAGMCVASMKNSWTQGMAGTIGIYPIVRNRQRFPGGGRDTKSCTADVGMAGAWFKKGLHHAFLYKLSAKPMWKLIP